MKKIIKAIGLCLGVIALAAAAFILYLFVTDYRPQDDEEVVLEGSGSRAIAPGDALSVLTFNIGYGGLDADTDFFMDGGSAVLATSKEKVESNISGVGDILTRENTDVVFLQEVDLDSKRSWNVNEAELLAGRLSDRSMAYGVNYRCRYIPYPWPMMGKVEGGLVTYNALAAENTAVRKALPGSFSWPVSMCQLKRCLLVERVPLEGTEQELVLVNLHLEAYDSDGGGKKAQTKVLYELLQREYEKGNYVIAGGDFNQTFDTVPEDLYPLKFTDHFMPGRIDTSVLGEGWTFANDVSAPTSRLLNEPYDPDSENTQYYMLDGFILSPNVTLTAVKTLDEGFAYTDHNPVRVDVVLDTQND